MKKKKRLKSLKISELDKDNGRVYLMLYDYYKSIGENEKALRSSLELLKAAA